MHIPEKSQRILLKPLQPWLIRQLEVARGAVTFELELFPAFNYALDSHETVLVDYSVNATDEFFENQQPSYVGTKRAIFTSNTLTLDLRYIILSIDTDLPPPKFELKISTRDKLKGPGVSAEFTLEEGQQIIFILREVPNTPNSKAYLKSLPPKLTDPPLTASLMQALYRQTFNYWQDWIGQSTYQGRWRENVHRSALALKLMTYEPVNIHIIIMVNLLDQISYESLPLDWCHCGIAHI